MTSLEPGARVRVTQVGVVLDDRGSIEYEDDGTVEVIAAPPEEPAEAAE